MTDQKINETLARKLGWHKGLLDPNSWGKPTDVPGHYLHQALPDYCHSIEAAWEIVNKIEKDKLGWNLSYDAAVRSYIFRYGPFSIQSNVHESRADTAPMAICKAFLALRRKT